MNKKLVLYSFISMLFWSLTANVFAQEVFNPYPCIAANTLPSGCIGRSYSIQFETDISALSFSTTIDDDLNLSINGAGILGGSIPNNPSLVNTYTFQVTATFPDGPDADSDPDESTKTFTLTIDPPCAFSTNPVNPCLREVAFILDNSGSMLSPGNDAGDSRWEIVNDEMEDYLDVLRVVPSPNLGTADLFGVVRFAGDEAELIQAPTGVSGTDFPDLTPFTPGGLTPLGGGVQRAMMNIFTELGEPGQGKKRFIIALTDGLQNRSPRIQNDRSVQLDGSPAGGILGPGSGKGTLPFSFATDPDIGSVEIFTIGVGTGLTSNAEVLLRDFSGGDANYVSTYEMSSELVSFLNTTIPNALANSTPRILDIRQDRYLPNTGFKIEEFVVNDSVQGLTIQLKNISGRFIEPQVIIAKDGEVLDAPPFRFTDDMVLYDFEFPAENIGLTNPESSRGVWEIRFRNNETFNYIVTGFVDEYRIHHSLDFQGKSNLYVGDDIPVRVKIWDRGMPITDASVEAIILRPGDDLGDLLADTDAPQDSFIFTEPQMLLGQAKLNYLLQQPGFKIRFQKVANRITLEHDEDGEYMGTFLGNEVTGSYQVIALIEGEHPTLGPFEGREASSLVLDFAEAKNIDLNLIITQFGKGDGLNLYRVNMTPINQFGRKLGPAQEGRITVLVGNTEVVLEDQLDGSYSGTFSADPSDNPRVRVNVIDPINPVVEKPLSRFIPKFGLSLHGGYVWSRNNAAPLTNSSDGNYFEVDMSYRVSQKITLQLLGGSYNFDGNFNISGVSLLGEYAILNPRSPGFFLNASVGLGGFKPENQDLTLGVAAKANFGWRLNSNLEIGVDFGGFVIPDPNYQYNSAGVGLRYFF